MNHSKTQYKVSRNPKSPKTNQNYKYRNNQTNCQNQIIKNTPKPKPKPNPKPKPKPKPKPNPCFVNPKTHNRNNPIQ